MGCRRRRRTLSADPAGGERWLALSPLGEFASIPAATADGKTDSNRVPAVAVDRKSTVSTPTHADNALVLLAAGRSTRFGRLKQLAAIGPGGTTLIDYAVYDAKQVGFRRVVFVVRAEIEADMRAAYGNRFTDMTVEFVHQNLDDLPRGCVCPPGRERPWGTAHAVWAARSAVRERFAVISADDFYGRHAYEQLARQVFNPAADHDAAAIIGFQLGGTLSKFGGVSRGVCEVGPDDNLIATHEYRVIEDRPEGPVAIEGNREIKLSRDAPVSMNMWSFPATLPALLEDEHRGFFAELTPDDRLSRELYLTDCARRLVENGKLRIHVPRAESEWFGVTYDADTPIVRQKIDALIEAGAYPADLWAK
ncbi:MAG: nucleotidyltransferase [Myxococcales bacterium FL481]|nr:MAG: nucleotidyltransferase [Myxococcales bacterium FL481]